MTKGGTWGRLGILPTYAQHEGPTCPGVWSITCQSRDSEHNFNRRWAQMHRAVSNISCCSVSKRWSRGWGCSSETEYLASMHKFLVQSPASKRERERKMTQKCPKQRMKYLRYRGQQECLTGLDFWAHVKPLRRSRNSCKEQHCNELGVMHEKKVGKKNQWHFGVRKQMNHL